jgi:hypothetical protein
MRDDATQERHRRPFPFPAGKSLGFSSPSFVGNTISEYVITSWISFTSSRRLFMRVFCLPLALDR